MKIMQANALMQQNINLKPFNTFGINANARYFAEARNPEDFVTLLSNDLLRNLPKQLLGGGSNILLTEDYPGLVIKNSIKGITKLSSDAEHVKLKIGAGENWHQFVMYCIEKGYGGIENLSLIPGTVGAAPIQNIGAYGVELCDVFIELEALNLNNGIIEIFSNQDCRFGYRDSIFKNSHKNAYAILSVTLQLNKKPQFHVDYGNIREMLEQMQIQELSIKAISDAVIKIRRSKLPDPADIGNAGSFFKNPIIPSHLFAELQKQFPNIPHFATDTLDTVKISAAWLIEQAGWKGKRFGNVGVYDKQALIIVNYGNGTGAEIKALATNIQNSVQSQFGILLTPEVNFI